MATDLDRLVVSLDADVRGLLNQLKKAGIAVESFGRDADRQTKAVTKKISENLAANDNKGLNTNQFQILGHAARASFEAIAAGASPLRVVAQEAVKASAAVGEGGLASLMGDLAASAASVVTPTAVATGGIVALGAAALYAATSFQSAESEIKLGLSGIGAASHATVTDIEEIGAAIAQNQKISVSAGRDIALQLAKTGKIGVENIQAVGDLAPGFAKLTGTDLAEAGKQLAGIFADPAKGAATLNAVLGSLDGQTLAYIDTLTRQGDRQRAIEVLVARTAPELKKAAETTGLWAKAWNAVAAGASSAAAAVGSAVSGAVDPTLDQQIAVLQRKVANGKSYQADPQALRDAFAGSDLTDDQIQALPNAQFEQDKRRLQELLDLREKLNKDSAADAGSKEAAQLTARASEIVRTYDEAGVAIKNVQADLIQLGKAIASSIANPDQQPEGGTAKALQSYNDLGARLAQLKSEYEAGGAAAASALREANFSKSIASASSFERGLAEINHRYDELILKADTAQAKTTLNAARQGEVEAYRGQTQQRAQSSFSLPDDFASIVIGAEGNNAAKNPLSSASGIGQFIDKTFIDQYRKVFSDLASTMSDAAILQLKTDAAVNKPLIENYGKEIGAALVAQGIEPSLRNLYLGYHFGPGGAAALLKADPNASAASVLGPAVARENPNEVGNNSVADLIGNVDRRVQRNSSAGRAQQDAIIAERANAEAIGQSASEIQRLDSIQQQLNADREKGGSLGQQFATAQDLIKASSSSLTPALAKQREEILALAAARAKAAEAGLSTRFQNDLQEAYAALGRTSEQQAVYEQAKSYATPGSDQFAKVSDELTKLHDLTEAKSDTGDFVKGLVGDLIQGKSAAEALKDELTRLAEKVLDRGIDSLLSNLFGGASASGGLFAGLGHLFGFAEGGAVSGPGTGRSDSIPALLSNGEYVVNADATRRHGALLDAINSGRVLRFAAGGPVSLRTMPDTLPGPSRAAPISVVNSDTYNLMTAPGVTPQQLAVVIESNNRQRDKTLAARLSKSNMRFA